MRRRSLAGPVWVPKGFLFSRPAARCMDCQVAQDLVSRWHAGGRGGETGRMWEQLKSFDGWATAILATALLSVAVWVLVFALGYHKPPASSPYGYEPYFEQRNWWPLPFVFLALAPGLWLTWKPMLRAWSKLAETGVLLGSGGKPDDATVQQVLGAIRRQRRGAVFVALAIALLVNLADWVPRYDIFIGTAKLDDQLEYACDYPSTFVRWIFVDETIDARAACTPAAEQPSLDEDNDGIRPPLDQVLFNAILMAQQFLIVLFAALAVVQLLLHTLLFAIFERLAIARDHGLFLRLSCNSPLNEFGLEHWNHALNNFYWAVSPALLGVFLSRSSTPAADFLPGQVLLGIAVPACLIAPMVATILARQARLPAAWKTVQLDGPIGPEDFRRQQLWPLDRNWSSKLGIVLAFALAAISIGVELTRFMTL